MQTEKIIDTKKEISDLKENIPNNQKIDLGELPPPPKFEEKKKVGFLSKIMGTKEKKSPSKIDKLPLPPVPGNEEPNLTGLNDMPDPLAPSAMTIPEPPVMHEDNNQQLNTELEKQVIAKEDSKSSFSMPEPPSFSNDSKVEELNMPGLKSENINKNPSSIPPPPSFSIDMKKEEPIKPFEKLDSDLKKLDVVSKEAISIPHPPSAPKSKESKPKKGLFGGLLGKKKKDVKNLDLKTEIKKEDVTKKNDLSLPPSFDKKESFDFKPPKLEEPKSISLPPEEKIGDLPKPPVFDVEMSPTSEFEVLATDKKEEIVDKKVEVKSLIDEDKEINDLLAKMKKESADFKDEDSVDFGTKLESELVQEVTPLHEVPGIGQKRKDELESVGIGSAEVLADTHEDHIVEKTNIPRAHAKKIIKHAKKIKKKTSRRKKVATHKKVSVHKKKKSANKEQSISELIKELEAEKSELKKIEKSSADIPDIKGHEKIILLLEQLEKKKMELIIYEKELETNKSKLDSHKGKYSRDYANLEQLRRRLDHDIRERTQYLIDLERDFYKKGQDLAKRESVIKIQEGEIKNKIDSFKDTEKKLRKLENTLHDREITTKTKEQKLNSILMELDK
ncbi:hypothetical protein HN451_06615, partial [archaeon]|nr:hypothetical protein [archaeon]